MQIYTESVNLQYPLLELGTLWCGDTRMSKEDVASGLRKLTVQLGDWRCLQEGERRRARGVNTTAYIYPCIRAVKSELC